jgi:hypothetical protein
MRIWIHGLIAAVLSAIGDAGTTVLGGVVFAPALLSDSGFRKVLAGTIIFSAGKTVFAYLKGSPLPRDCDAGE